MEIRVTVEGAIPIAQRYERAPKIMEELFTSNFRTLGGHVAWVMRTHMQPKKYTGQMERSVSWEVAPRPPWVAIGPTAPHAQYVLNGTPPHWAPIQPLLRWAEWKLGDAKAAYKVQRKIAKFGTEGYDFLEMTMQDARFQSALVNTAGRLGMDLVARLEK